MTKKMKKVLHDVGPSLFAIKDIAEILVEMTSESFSMEKLGQVIKGLENIYQLSSTLTLYINDLSSEIDDSHSLV